MNKKICILNDLLSLETDMEKLEVVIDDLQDGYFDEMEKYNIVNAPYMQKKAELRLHIMRDYVNQMQDTIKLLVDGIENGKD